MIFLPWVILMEMEMEMELEVEVEWLGGQ